MFRIKLVVIMVGGMLAYSGIQEMRVSMGTSSEPEAVALLDLESGTTPENNHVLIGDHVAVYGGAVYEYKQRKYENGEPGPNTKVTHCYYPIISEQHPFFDALNAASQKHGSETEIPDDEYPAIDNFKVLVKTKGFKTIGDIPNGLSPESSVQGMVVNSIAGLDDEEKALVHTSFPNTDIDNLLMIESGRKPASLAKSLGWIGGGSLLCLFGIATLFMGGRK